MTALRVGAVGYLNARPLVRGLGSSGLFSVRFDVPSRCAELLATNAIDIGLIPVAEYRADEYVAVPGICIGSSGPVASVALFSQKPVEAVRSIALDTSSRTSAALVRILCAERWGTSPTFSAGAPDLAAMLRGADAALLIGDPALEAEPERLGALKIDLGAEWTALTGLPFVWALWAGREPAVSPDVCKALGAARDAGRQAIEAIAEEYACGDPRRSRRAVDYLRTNIAYDLDAAHVAGLDRFFSSAAKAGIIPQAGRLRFARSAVTARV
jgi:chorismate dehydratase